MGFGVQLRAAREAAGLSQQGLADRAGIKVDSIQNWEQDRTMPRLPALGLLAAALGVSLDTLIIGNGSKDEGKRPRGRPRKVAEAAPVVRKRGKK
jgi:transcriptional regulator with XRE-family HTH domain